jgi:hypothetical protein
MNKNLTTSGICTIKIALCEYSFTQKYAMKNLIIISVFSFLILGRIVAQDGNPNISEEKTMTSANASRTNNLASFKNQFDQTNVGNLHLFSRSKTTTNTDYYFTGKKIDPIFQQYLPPRIQKYILDPDKQPYAIGAVRGEGLDDYYIMRDNAGEWPNKLVLYEINNGQLTPKRTLAYFYKKRNKSYQLDSWMQDVNGDTRLDLIQKSQVKDADGNINSATTKVFLRKENGKFKRSRNTKIDKSDYHMEVIKL